MANLLQETGFYLRVYDGATPRHYTIIPLLEPPSVDILPPQPEENLVLNSGRVDAYAGYIVPNEASIFQPLEFTLEFRLISDEQSRMNALGNPRDLNPWKVGADTWVPVDPADIGTRQDSQGNPIVPPISAIFRSTAYLVDIYYYYGPPASDVSSTPMIIGRQGCVLSQTQVNIVNQEVHGIFTMRQFGGFDFSQTDWPAGTESVAT